MIAALVVGLVLSRRRTVSLRSAGEAAAAEKAAPTKGTYTTGSSISFSSAPSGTAVLDRPETPEPVPAPQVPPVAPAVPAPTWVRTETDGQPGVGDDASVPRDSDRPELTDLELPTDLAPAPITEVGTGSTPVFAPVDRPERAERPAIAPTVAHHRPGRDRAGRRAAVPAARSPQPHPEHLRPVHARPARRR